MFQLFPLLERDAQDFAQASTNAQRLAYPENNFTVTAMQALTGSGVQSLWSPQTALGTFLVTGLQLRLTRKINGK